MYCLACRLVHCRAGLYMWLLCLGLPVTFLCAASMLTPPRIVLLSTLDWSVSSVFLFCLKTVAAQNVEYYIYMCSPSACLSALFCSAPVTTSFSFSFSLSLSLRPLVAVTVYPRAFLSWVPWLPRCCSVSCEMGCWFVSRLPSRHIFRFLFFFFSHQGPWL